MENGLNQTLLNKQSDQTSYANPPEGTQVNYKFETFPQIQRLPIVLGNDEKAQDQLKKLAIGKFGQLAGNLSIIFLFTDFNFTEPIYEAIVLCIIPLNFFGTLLLIIELSSIFKAKSNPKLLCSAQWDKRQKCVSGALGMLQLLCLLNLACAPLWAKLLDESKFSHAERNAREWVILVIYIMLLVMTAVVLLFVAGIICKVMTSSKAIAAEKQEIKSKLSSAALLKYEDLQTEQTHCGLCYAQFEANSNIAQVKCTETHIFHRWCLEQQLEAKDELGKLNKCVLCAETLDF